MRFQILTLTLLLASPAFSEVPASTSRMVAAAQDSGIRLTLSASAAQELLPQNNPYGADLSLQLVAEPHEEKANVLKAYRVVVTKASTGEEIPHFAFSSPVTLQFGYWTLFSRTPSTSAWTSVREAKTVLGAYWFNGQEFIGVHELMTNADGSIALTVHNTGRYEIRAAAAPSSFRLSSGSPYPRVITPNAAHNRRVFFFFESPAQQDVTGTIYDFLGAKIRDLHVDALSPSANSLVWDGRDNNGNVVPSGPYLYKIVAGNESATGGLAVAR